MHFYADPLVISKRIIQASADPNQQLQNIQGHRRRAGVRLYWMQIGRVS